MEGIGPCVWLGGEKAFSLRRVDKKERGKGRNVVDVEGQGQQEDAKIGSVVERDFEKKKAIEQNLKKI